MSTNAHTRDFDVVQRAEREVVQARRQRRGVSEGAPQWGLALSGGGVRSSAFALGVLQALHASGLYRKLDYVSGVGGGGCTGASLAWLTRASASIPTDPASFLRGRADYLDPRASGISLTSLLGRIAAQSVMSLLIYGSILTGLFFVLSIADAVWELFKPVLLTASRKDWWQASVASTNAALIFGLLCAAGTLAWRLASRVLSWFGQLLLRAAPADARVAYQRSLRRQRRLGILLVVISTALVLGSVPLAFDVVAWLLPDETLRVLAFVTLLGLEIGLLVRAFGRPLRSAERGDVALAAITLYTLLLTSHGTARVISDSGWVSSIFIVVAIAALASFAMNLNSFGPARIYRDRLIEAFLPDAQAIARQRWQPAVEAAGFALVELAGAPTAAPFPLINCNVTVPRSSIDACRDRGGDSFVLSPVFCGSRSTGWRTTSSWPQRRPITLGTAMAISGGSMTVAATDDRWGGLGRRLSSAMRAILNLRLGHWVENPDPSFGRKARGVPTISAPGVRQGVLGLGLSELEPWVQITDGAHFDPLGVYELVRRELDVIIVSDASTGSSYENFGRVAQRIRSDFGAEIEIDLGLGCTERGYARGVIRYASGREGALLFIKALLPAVLPVDVRTFAQAHAEFPRASRSGYELGEDEFEAYRMLGLTIAVGALDELQPMANRAVPVASMSRELGGDSTPPLESMSRELGAGSNTKRAAEQ